MGSLGLLRSLAAASGPPHEEVLAVDLRPGPTSPPKAPNFKLVRMGQILGLLDLDSPRPLEASPLRPFSELESERRRHPRPPLTIG